MKPKKTKLMWAAWNPQEGIMDVAHERDSVRMWAYAGDKLVRVRVTVIDKVKP